MAFGGAGPLHGVSLAEAISAKNVISPLQPGITAATGLLVTDIRYEYTASLITVLNKADEADFGQINQIVDDLQSEADRQLDDDGIAADRRRYERIAECRYVGQGCDLRARIPDGPRATDTVDQLT